MPIAPQITNTPIDLIYFEITAVSYTSSTATYTATGHSYQIGDTVTISGLAPDGYNGVFTVTGITTNTFTVANTTNATVTDAEGDSYGQPSDDSFEASYTPTVYLTDTDDLADPAVNPALADAATALANAATAYTAAVGSLQPSASTIVNASNQMTAIAANGITVYSGSSPSSGARVVLNSAGLAGYDSGGSATFAIAASTGAATFKGEIVTGSRITGGELNIGGNCIISTSGYLTATGASITGSITASSGAIGGWTIGSTKMYSGTSELDSTTGNAVFNKVTGFGQIYGYADLWITTTAYIGSSLEVSASATLGSGATYPFKYFSSTGVLQSPGTYNNTGVSTRAVYVASSGNLGVNTSTLRRKHEIEPYAINSSALLNLDVKKFKFKPEIDPDQHIQYGFIAEQAQELGLEELIQYDPEGLVDYFAYEKLPIFLLQIAQEQNARLNALEGK